MLCAVQVVLHVLRALIDLLPQAGTDDDESDPSDPLLPPPYLEQCCAAVAQVLPSMTGQEIAAVAEVLAQLGVTRQLGGSRAEETEEEDVDDGVLNLF